VGFVDPNCMAFEGKWTALKHLQEGEQQTDNRCKPRFLANNVNCERGKLLDFSASGVRVRYTRCPKFSEGDVIDLELFSNLGQHNCSVKAIRITKMSFRNYEVGFEFTDMESAKQMQLFRLGFDPMCGGQWSIRD
jgi:c-di-GMP-binding flagellar brake protein YcgR